MNGNQDLPTHWGRKSPSPNGKVRVDEAGTPHQFFSRSIYPIRPIQRTYRNLRHAVTPDRFIFLTNPWRLRPKLWAAFCLLPWHLRIASSIMRRSKALTASFSDWPRSDSSSPGVSFGGDSVWRFSCSSVITLGLTVATRRLISFSNWRVLPGHA